MIITKEVEVCIVPSNIKYYKSVGIDAKLMKKILIPIDILQNQSNCKVDVRCDRCGLDRNIKYQAYYLNINRSQDKKTYTCDKCSHEKTRKTNQLKYGADYFSKTDQFLYKIKETSMSKFGETHFSKTDEYIKKRDQTNLEKFGVKNPFELTKLVRIGMLEKYGFEHPSQVEDIKDRIQKSRRITKELKGDWIKSEERSEWILYKNKVRSLTYKNKKNLYLDWDGFDFYDGEYIKDNLNLNHNNNLYPTIDHKISIFYGFIQGFPPEFISSIDNLCLTKRINNIKKGIK